MVGTTTLSERIAASKRQREQAAAQKPAETAKAPQQTTLAKQPAKRKEQLQREKVPDIHKTPPHAPEAELGVLSSMMFKTHEAIMQCNSAGLQPHWFFVPAHKTIYEEIRDMWDSGATKIDMITLGDWLEKKGILEAIGGRAKTTGVQLKLDEVRRFPSISNLDYYIDIMREKYALREMIALGTHMVRASYAVIADDEPAELLNKFSFKLSRLKQTASPNGAHELSITQLIEMKDQPDPNTLVGHRWLVREGNSLWAGGAGYGKSSLLMQISTYWACAQPIFGIKPLRPLKILIVQAENDDFDMAEMFNGVLAGIEAAGDLNAIDRTKLEQNLHLARVDGVSGRAFIAELETLLTAYKPEIVWIDPLFAFAGCDLLDSKATGYFLRELLFPMFKKYRCCGNVVHHVGKPPRSQNDNAVTTAIDEQYLSFGSSEIQNAFRAINVLKPPTKEHPGVYKLVLSKRGQRAGAKSPDGEHTRDIFLEQAFPHICWLQVSEPKKQGKSRINVDRVMEQLNTTTPKTSRELEEILVRGAVSKMSRATLFRALETIESEKLARSTEDGWLMKSQQSHSVSEAL